MEHKTMYVCDPEKARSCKKNTCYKNSSATYPVCDRTSHVEWAVTDQAGNPLKDVLQLDKKENYVK